MADYVQDELLSVAAESRGCSYHRIVMPLKVHFVMVWKEMNGRRDQAIRNNFFCLKFRI